MTRRERLQRGVSERSMLGAILAVVFFALMAVDWIHRTLGASVMMLIMLGLLGLTLAFAWWTYERFKASGLKPPSLGELRAMSAASQDELESKPPISSETSKVD